MAAGDTQITIIGNLVDDPQLRYTPTGQAVASFRVASTPRFMDRQTNEWKDGDSLFLSCNVWRQAAENVAESLQRGMRVIVSGRLRQRSYETKEGEKRTVYEIEVDEVGPSLRNASAKVVKSSRATGGQGGSGGQGGYGSGGGAAAAALPTTPGRPSRPTAASATSHRSSTSPALGRDQPSPLAGTDHPRRRRGSAKEHHDGQATDPQAQEEGLPVLPGEGHPGGLQGHSHAA